MSLKTLFRALGLVLGASIPLLAGPSSPPAGNYIQNVSTTAAAPAFSVSSGTVAGMLRVGSCQTLTGGSCGAGGGSTATINLAGQYSDAYYSAPGSSNVISGLAAGTTWQALLSGGTGAPPFWYPVILSTTVLQSGATFYVSSGTLAVQLNIGTGSNAYAIYPGSLQLKIQSPNTYGISLYAGNTESFYVSTTVARADEPVQIVESAAPSGTSGSDFLWGDSTYHWPRFNPNGSSSNYLVIGSSTSNTAGHLVQWSGNGASLVDGGAGQFINNTSSLQSGSTFYVSSGTVAGQLTVGSCVLSGGGSCGGGGGSVVLPSSGIAFGSPTNAVTSDTNTLTWNNTTKVLISSNIVASTNLMCPYIPIPVDPFNQGNGTSASILMSTNSGISPVPNFVYYNDGPPGVESVYLSGTPDAVETDTLFEVEANDAIQPNVFGTAIGAYNNLNQAGSTGYAFRSQAYGGAGNNTGTLYGSATGCEGMSGSYTGTCYGQYSIANSQGTNYGGYFQSINSQGTSYGVYAESYGSIYSFVNTALYAYAHGAGYSHALDIEGGDLYTNGSPGVQGNTLQSYGYNNEPQWGPLSLSGGSNYVSGILPSSNLPSTVGYLNSTNTWTAQQTFTLLNISTFTASSATVTGNTYLNNVNISGTCTGSGCGTKPALTYVFGGATNAAPLQAGTTVYIHTKFAGTINSVSLDCYPNVSDTFSVNVSTGASSNPNALSSICALDCPALSGASSETDTTLTGWTTAFTANSYIAVSLPSVPPVCTYAVLTIGVN